MYFQLISSNPEFCGRGLRLGAVKIMDGSKLPTHAPRAKIASRLLGVVGGCSCIANADYGWETCHPNTCGSSATRNRIDVFIITLARRPR